MVLSENLQLQTGLDNRPEVEKTPPHIIEAILAENPTNYFSPNSIFEEFTIGTRHERDGMGFVFSLSVFRKNPTKNFD